MDQSKFKKNVASVPYFLTGQKKFFARPPCRRAISLWLWANVSSRHGDVGGRWASSEDALPSGPQTVRVSCHWHSASFFISVGLLKTQNILLYHRVDCLFLYVIHFRVTEEVFWRNYFYRVSLIKQSAQLTALAAQQAAERREVEKTGPSHEAVHQNGETIVSAFHLKLLSV